MKIKRYYEDRSQAYSRYRSLKRIEYEDGTKRVETANPVNIPEKEGDTFFKVTYQYENRLDLIAFKFYNNQLYWWVIAYASNIKDPFNVPSGTVLRIPNPITLYTIEDNLNGRVI